MILFGIIVTQISNNEVYMLNKTMHITALLAVSGREQSSAHAYSMQIVVVVGMERLNCSQPDHAVVGLQSTVIRNMAYHKNSDV